MATAALCLATCFCSFPWASTDWRAAVQWAGSVFSSPATLFFRVNFQRRISSWLCPARWPCEHDCWHRAGMYGWEQLCPFWWRRVWIVFIQLWKSTRRGETYLLDWRAFQVTNTKFVWICLVNFGSTAHCEDNCCVWEKERELIMPLKIAPYVWRL